MATAVARLLADGGHPVTLLEATPAGAADLRARLGGVDVVVGSPTDPLDLESAGIRGVDVVAGLTARDEVNLVAASLARFEFGVPRTIARIVDPRHAWLYTPAMGVDVGLNQADLLASLVAEELSLGEMRILLRLRRGQFELIEERIHPAAVAVGQAVRDLALPRESVLVAVLRAEGPVVPRGDLVLRAGDEVMAVVRSGLAPDVAAVLGPPPRGA